MNKGIGIVLLIFAVLCGLIALLNGVALFLNLASWIGESDYYSIVIRASIAVVTAFIAYRLFVAGRAKLSTREPSPGGA